MKKAIIFLLLCSTVYAGDRYFYIQQFTGASDGDKQKLKAVVKKIDPDIDFGNVKIIYRKANTNIASRIVCYDFENVLVKYNKSQLTNAWAELRATLDNPSHTDIYVGSKRAWAEDWQEGE